MMISNCHKIIVLFFSVLTVFSETLAGQQPLTLQQAIADGLKNRHNIQISEKQIEIAEISNSWARAGKYPTISADVNMGNTVTQENNQASFLRGQFYVGSLTPSLNLNWTLYNGGLTGATKENLEVNVALQKQLATNTVQQTIQEIHQAYYSVLLQESRLNTLQQVKNLSKDRLDYEKTRKTFGVSNTFSLIQFEDGYLADSAAYVVQNNQVIVARRNLFQAMNVQVVGDYYELTDPLEIIASDMDRDELENQLLDNNPDLNILAINQRLAAINTKVEQSINKPVISFNSGLSGSYTAFKVFADDPSTGEPFATRTGDTYRLTANISATYNLWDGGLRKQNIENARLQQEIAALDILEASAALKTQLNILVDNYNNQLAQLNILDAQLSNATLNLEISEERLKSGQINSLDYRAVQNTYTNVAFSRINAIYNLLSIRADIAYLVGDLGQ
jgi:outer membrane protein TolC